MEKEAGLEETGLAMKCQTALKGSPVRSPSPCPLLCRMGRDLGIYTKGSGGGKGDTCKPDAGRIFPRARSSHGKEGTWLICVPAVILPTRWQKA